MFTILVVFFLPLIVRASIFAFSGDPTNWRDADWSSTGMLPPASAAPQARVLIMYGRAGGLKGVVGVHSWIVIKSANAHSWTRYDVVGWGEPLRTNNWPPDGRWFGTTPTVLADVSGVEAEALIPKIETAIKDYRYDRAGDYRLWPGPNSNTFVATVLRAVPDLGIALPSNAVGRDFRSLPYAGLTDSRTGVEGKSLGTARRQDRARRGHRGQRARSRRRNRLAPASDKASGFRPDRLRAVARSGLGLTW